MSLYTLVAWVTRADGSVMREVVNADWRGPFHEMDRRAVELTASYANVGRRYQAVSVSEVSG